MPVERTDTSVDAGPAPIDLTESALSEQYHQAEVIHALGEVMMTALDMNRRYARHRTDCMERARMHPITHRCDCGFKEESENLDAKVDTLTALLGLTGGEGGISP